MNGERIKWEFIEFPVDGVVFRTVHCIQANALINQSVRHIWACKTNLFISFFWTNKTSPFRDVASHFMTFIYQPQ